MTSMYEGIALIQEKQAVVLELGSEYCRFGFAGEAAPRCIVRSQYWCPARRAPRRLADCREPDDLYRGLVLLLHQLYFRHVLVNPKERRVVVVESLLTPTLFRETLARVLFTHYEVSGVVWADAPRAVSLTLGAPAALVVDVGAAEVQLAAVMHGSLILRAGLPAAPLGARALHAELLRLLREHPGQEELQLADTDLEDIKVKTCFVTSRERALAWQEGRAPAECPGVRWAARGGGVWVSGRARELAAEVMFARDAERASLPDLVLQLLEAAPRDARRALAAGVVLCGGGAALPGLRARLAAELRALAAEPPHADRPLRFMFHTPPCPVNCAAWCGGALLGAAEAGAARAQPRDHYLRARRVRDWVCLLDNTPPDHPYRAQTDL